MNKMTAAQHRCLDEVLTAPDGMLHRRDDRVWTVKNVKIEYSPRNWFDYSTVHALIVRKIFEVAARNGPIITAVRIRRDPCRNL